MFPGAVRITCFAWAVSLIFLASCGKDQIAVENDQNQIISFTFKELPVPIEATVDTALRLISAKVPAQLDLSKLVPTIAISPNASINPKSGIPNDSLKKLFIRFFQKPDVSPIILSSSPKWTISMQFLSLTFPISFRMDNYRAIPSPFASLSEPISRR
jgi:hypothetical protein